ncbi:tyrosine-type recombinase/integrase [Candidatus Pacearchaeota archaeon]|nr:tyrosine-type recombinase/integrase [Candidatus Pacearchaeota archaeon]
MEDIHNYKRRLERTLERVNKLDLYPEDKELIYRFKDLCICQNISYGKLDAYLFYTIKLTNFLQKPIKEANKEDIMNVIAKLNETNYSEQTKKCFKVLLKKLYKYIRGIEGKGEYPEEVKWMSTTISRNHQKLPDELINENEIESIIRAAQNTRDKALISILAESGCRVSEIGLMKIKNVSFEEYGTRIAVSGKTGSRKILVINSTPYLQEWINQHPLNNNSDSFLWYNPLNSKYLSYTRITSILKTAAKRAGIKKRIHPHLLRHSRATKMATVMSEASMKQYFGWTQGSSMAGVYVHLSGKDTDDAILKANGIEITKKEMIITKMKPIICNRCKTSNEATNRFCKICGLPLTKEIAEETIKEDSEKKKFEDILEIALSDKKVLEMIKEKMKVIL